MKHLEFIKQLLARWSGRESTEEARHISSKLESNFYVRIGIVSAVLVALWFLVELPLEGTRFEHERMKGMLTGALILGVSFFHLHLGHRTTVFYRNSRLILVYGLILAQLLIAKVIQLSLPEADQDRALLFIPLAFSAMLISVLLGQRMGIFAALYTSLWMALLLNADNAYLHIITCLATGLTAVWITAHVRKRSRLIRAGFAVGIAHLVLVWAFGLIRPLNIEFGETPWTLMFMDSGMVVLIELVAAILVSGFLPMLESSFKITTEISWIEMSDLNHPLLKKMTLEAPGTYHHSLIVATLAENAAEAIGANATMARVCCYFHDIGKLEKPQYFIENQGEGVNPHDNLTPHMSGRKIIAHVTDGVSKATKQGLNPQIIDIIREHHGTSLMYFFYRKALHVREQQLEEVKKGLRNSEDVIEVKEEEFRYPGPKPRSRESAIISLADAIESASRTLPDRETETIRKLVNDIVQGRMRENQLDEADLTLRELNTICRSFEGNLKSILHARVHYPKEINSIPDITDHGEPAAHVETAAYSKSDTMPWKDNQRDSAAKRSAKKLMSSEPADEKGEGNKAETSPPKKTSTGKQQRTTSSSTRGSVEGLEDM